ncbi:efflux transporter outer membrane subunit [Roseateles asaccharophilus]|uniref:NodT family efflux transporter outer membrane factor (OMF) lipoprotein n=1 Tax=Roseateles asaccharophilus TaxID=582607 RepID=A0ABU2A3Z0_9BURK|nr:efflux transporter outer membrane subunit [Roseateles asaccharophilus]MDR7331913.1 NodT family efflux transporter outer membrane factor (OMF) lipoprotein [Roseateles asaccharophilus]
MKRAHLTLMAAACTLLAGCGSLVPPTEKIAPPLRQDFRPGMTPINLPTDTANEWDGFFADARLRKVVGIALLENRGLRASAAVVERVRAQHRITEADRIPDLNAGASATRQQVAGGATTSSYAVNLGLASYEIDLFNRLASLEGAALSRYLAQQQTQRSAQLSLVAEVSNAWLTLAAEQQRLTLAQQLRDSQQRTLSLTEQRHQLGAASGLERARARTAFEAARGEATRAAAAITQARLALELLAGQPLPDDLLPTTQGMEALTALPALPGGLPAEVLLQRPDLRAAEQALQAAAFDVGAARAARFPRLTLTASGGTRSPELDGLFKSSTGFWSVVPQLDLPLFDGGARAAQVEVSQANRRQALATYEGALQSAFREAADALAVRDSLAERLDAQQAQVAAAAQSLRFSEDSYRLGGSSQLELLDAQRQLATAQQALITLRLAEQANRVTLLRALGGRWAAS